MAIADPVVAPDAEQADERVTLGLTDQIHAFVRSEDLVEDAEVVCDSMGRVLGRAGGETDRSVRRLCSEPLDQARPLREIGMREGGPAVPLRLEGSKAAS
mgnify:CR=1 FL=1